MNQLRLSEEVSRFRIEPVHITLFEICDVQFQAPVSRVTSGKSLVPVKTNQGFPLLTTFAEQGTTPNSSHLLLEKEIIC